jgi:amino acid transporter
MNDYLDELQIIPICATMPSLSYILNAPLAQALPYIYAAVMGDAGGAAALTVLVLVITLFCSISITVAASRCTWAFARDNAIPGARLFSKVDKRHGTPIWALVLTTLVQMVLGLIDLGSSTAFNAFVSVGVIALAVSYGIPIALSMAHGRQGVNHARWTIGPTIGWIVNVVSVTWIAFETVLFSMPTAIPVTDSTMNYAIVVFVGFMALSAVWYAVYAHKGMIVPRKGDLNKTVLLTKHVVDSLQGTARVRRPCCGFLVMLQGNCLIARYRDWRVVFVVENSRSD